ncbi:WW domain-containing oxidoreductase [Micractinium conductrix]|uniref:WW domain-containing oxidoreductase n=1 Tax=Micractinium conductrix TaxID=554055 RepID=A0A2P6V327_9CHLO|nr:WW domain-containing oxidoreductase [Micractinium conductrix]|eukprot:PSC68474.1 WW domain-containing oxidoreductase [Micractinium conductrix]
MAKPLGHRSTALEALQGADLTGKLAVVTGGNSGIGVETVKALAHAGADVMLCSRSVEAGDRVAAELQAGGVKGKIRVKQLDLADLASVKAMGAELAASLPRLDLLILNAGVMACPKGTTKQGFETQIGTNHFGHFYLTQLLLPKMKAQGAPARVVVVSSSAHTMVKGIPLDDINFEHRKYGAWSSYGQSKLANVLFAKELARRLGEEGSPVKAFCLHPGVIKTNLQRHMGFSAFLLNTFAGPFMKTVPQGAATSVYSATAPELEQRSGAYLADCKVAAASKAGQDAELAKAFWTKSEEMLAAALAQAGL